MASLLYIKPNMLVFIRSVYRGNTGNFLKKHFLVSPSNVPGTPKMAAAEINQKNSDFVVT